MPNPSTKLDSGNQKIVWMVVRSTLYHTKFLGDWTCLAFNMTSKRIPHPSLVTAAVGTCCNGLSTSVTNLIATPSCYGPEPENLQNTES